MHAATPFARNLYLFLSAALLVAILHLCSQSVQAAPPASQPGAYAWAKWELRLSFSAANSPRARWIVTVGHYDPVTGDEIVDLTHHELLVCQVLGSVTIANGSATFHGLSATPGSIPCAMPSFAQAVFQLTGGSMVIPPSCSGREPWASGRLLPAGSASARENPIVSHPQIQFGLPIQNGGGQAKLALTLNANTLRSVSYPAPTQWQHYWAGESGGGRVAFRLNKARIGPRQPLPNFTFSTGPTSVVFGHNPATGAYYDGAMSHAAIDPGCFSQ